MFKPKYAVETFKSGEEFQTYLNNLPDGWQLHSFAPGAVAWVVAVFQTIPAPFVIPDVPAIGAVES